MTAYTVATVLMVTLHDCAAWLYRTGIIQSAYACLYLSDISTEYGNCTHGDIRLSSQADNSSALSRSGLLEVCVNGAWGTVCDELFDNNDAKVACAQLTGFNNQGKHYITLHYITMLYRHSVMLLLYALFVCCECQLASYLLQLLKCVIIILPQPGLSARHSCQLSKIKRT